MIINYDVDIQMLEKGKYEYMFLCIFGRCPLKPEIPQSLHQVSVSTKYSTVNYLECL